MSSPDVSTIADIQKNKRVSSGTDVNISASEISETPSSIDITTSADDQVRTDAPGSIDMITSADNQASTQASSSTEVFNSASVPASTNSPSSTDVSTRDDVRASKSAAQIITTSVTPVARDCSDILNQGYTENYGIYRIQPSTHSESFEVVCDLKTNGQEWIIFQRRFDGSEDFYLPWEDYKNGFGNLTGEHWLGLEKLHSLTTNGAWQLRVDLEDFSGTTTYAEYSNFVIGDESTYYRLSIGGYSGTAGDALAIHANMAFSTSDQDHDTGSNAHCAAKFKGAWWYRNCFVANLNGLYLGSPVIDPTGMSWKTLNNNYEVLKASEMKIRRVW